MLFRSVDYLVVAGGGGGSDSNGGGGGGGGGGYRYFTSVLLSRGVQYAVTVGGGGAGSATVGLGSNGVSSVFNSQTSTGGGYGAVSDTGAASGGSGGGGSYGKLAAMPDQNNMADLIRKKFKEAGFNDAQAEAAVANAWAESRFDPNAHNQRGEDSVGLFQMNRKGGLGSGYSVEQLKDPAFNIDLAADSKLIWPCL